MRPATGPVRSRFNLGAEWQQTRSLVENFDNVMGEKGSTQQTDLLQATQAFVFLRYIAPARYFSLGVTLAL